jgi:glycosyltransferase involved in cell wall biosynthesis
MATADRKNQITKRPLNMSIVEPSGSLYGSELSLLEILSGLSKGAFLPEVILPVNAAFSPYLKEANVPHLAYLRHPAHSRSRIGKLWSYLRIARHWSRKKPDLIYINQGGILRPISMIAGYLGIPVLCQIQTLEDAQWVSRLTRYHNRVSVFVCNTRFIAENSHVPTERRATVYLGYKPKGLRIPGRPITPTSGQLRVGLLGRICEQKGHNLVIQAAEKLQKDRSSKYRFCFIGETATERERVDFETRIKRSEASDIIELRGYRKNIKDELARLDLLIIPSVSESFGRILCEAAEAEVPVLLADSGGVGELSHRFNLGVQFKSDNVDDFIMQLHYIADNYEFVRQQFMTDAKRILAALNFESYISIIENIIEASALDKPTSITWLGEDVNADPGNSPK